MEGASCIFTFADAISSLDLDLLDALVWGGRCASVLSDLAILSKDLLLETSSPCQSAHRELKVTSQVAFVAG